MIYLYTCVTEWQSRSYLNLVFFFWFCFCSVFSRFFFFYTNCFLDSLLEYVHQLCGYTMCVCVCMCSILVRHLGTDRTHKTQSLNITPITEKKTIIITTTTTDLGRAHVLCENSNDERNENEIIVQEKQKQMCIWFCLCVCV